MNAPRNLILTKKFLKKKLINLSDTFRLKFCLLNFALGVWLVLSLLETPLRSKILATRGHFVIPMLTKNLPCI